MFGEVLALEDVLDMCLFCRCLFIKDDRWMLTVTEPLTRITPGDVWWSPGSRGCPGHVLVLSMSVYKGWLVNVDCHRAPDPEPEPEPEPEPTPLCEPPALESIPLPGDIPLPGEIPLPADIPLPAPAPEPQSMPVPTKKDKFKEKTVASLGPSSGGSVEFRKRKIASSARNVRQRDSDD